MSRASVLGDAIVADINTQSFSMKFVAKRIYKTLYEIKDQKVLTVTVLIPGMLHDVISRVGNQDTTSIIVLFAKHCDPEDSNTIDPLTDLVEEVADYFRDKNYGGSRWVPPTEIDPFYDIDNMTNKRLFASAINLKYRTTWK